MKLNEYETWEGTQEEYNAIKNKDHNTLYKIYTVKSDIDRVYANKILIRDQEFISKNIVRLEIFGVSLWILFILRFMLIIADEWWKALISVAVLILWSTILWQNIKELKLLRIDKKKRKKDSIK